MTICQAKEYIFTELQQLPVRALGHSLRWIEEADRLVLRLSDHRAANPTPVVLGGGVREAGGHFPDHQRQLGPERPLADLPAGVRSGGRLGSPPRRGMGAGPSGRV